jgi:hypothetical protein
VETGDELDAMLDTVLIVLRLKRPVGREGEKHIF